MRKEFTGMLPGAIAAFEELLLAAADLEPFVAKGYDSAAGRDSFFYWGCACRIVCNDMPALKKLAKKLAITWLSDEGDIAFTNGLKVDDFKTFRVNGNLELTPEREGM